MKQRRRNVYNSSDEESELSKEMSRLDQSLGKSDYKDDLNNLLSNITPIHDSNSMSFLYEF